MSYQVPPPPLDPLHGATEDQLRDWLQEKEIGGYLWIHADTCPVDHDEPCNCAWTLVGPVGMAWA